MSFRKAAYWTTTAFTALVPLLAGGTGNLLHVEPAVESDLAGASFSHAVTGHPAQRVIGPLVLLAIAGVSWALRPPSRTLVAPAPEPSSDPAVAKAGPPEPARA